MMRQGRWNAAIRREQVRMRGILTPRDAAKDLIRAYVLRGDDLEQLRSGGMGSYSRFYDAHIGGYLHTSPATDPPYGKPARKLAADQIGVNELHGKHCIAVFSLPELYREIKSGFVQVSLFEAMQ